MLLRARLLKRQPSRSELPGEVVGDLEIGVGVVFIRGVGGGFFCEEDNAFFVALLDLLSDVLWDEFVAAFNAGDAEMAFDDLLFQVGIDIEAHDFAAVFEVIDDIAFVIAFDGVVGDELIDLNGGGLVARVFFATFIEFTITLCFFCFGLLRLEFGFINGVGFLMALLLGLFVLTFFGLFDLLFVDDAGFKQLFLK